MSIKQKNVTKTIYLIMLMTMIMIIAGCSDNSQSNVTGNVATDTNDNPEKVTIYFFWGDGCPHCAAEKPFLEGLAQKYGDKIEVKMFETWKNADNANLFQKIALVYGTTAQGVPTTFIGDKFWVGYADYMGQEFDAKIQSCIDTRCVNPGDKLN